MPLPGLDQIKRKRQKVGLSRSRLAKLVGIDRQLLGRIEREDQIPKYDIAKQLFDELEVQEARSAGPMREVTVREVSAKSVIYAESHETTFEVWQRMEKEKISQFPVREKGTVIGSVTDRGISRALMAGKKNLPLLEPSVRSMVIEPSFPEIDADSSLPIAVSLLQISPAVLLKENGKVVGIMTNEDIGKALLPKRSG